MTSTFVQISRVIVVFLVSVTIPQLCSAAPPQHEPLSHIAHANNELGCDLLRLLSAGEHGKQNLVFSPYSVASALAMTYAGANGDTAAEIAAAAYLPFDASQVPQSFASLSAALQQPTTDESYTLKCANRLWGAAGYDYSPNYLSDLRTHYAAELFVLEFERNPTAAGNEINTWISEQTGRHINRLASPASVNRDTRLLLTNTVFFRGAWSRPFLPESTVEQPFRTSAGKSVTSRMMQQTGRFQYVETGDFKLLKLSYRGDQLSLILLLPGNPDGLSKLEESLSAKQLRMLMDDSNPAVVDISIPQFEISTTSSLKDVLQKQGVRRAFDSSADLSRIAGKTNLYLTAIAHQAFINVHEQGTEAAAATAVFVAKGLPPAVAEFHANHPFLFMVVHDDTGAILFLGHVVAPESSPRQQKNTPATTPNSSTD